MATDAADGSPTSPPTRYGVALFPGFQALDLFGPLDILNLLSFSTPLQLSIMSTTLEPVSTAVPSPGRHRGIGQSIVPTHTFADAPEIDVLIVPGGVGSRNLPGTQPVVDWIREVFPRVRYVLTVCTGSDLFARTGLLDGKRATTNKNRFDMVAARSPNVKWVRRARWVTDGKCWTSSGISAGMDMAYAFVAHQYGLDKAKDIAWRSEYIWNSDPDEDPFAIDC